MDKSCRWWWCYRLVWNVCYVGCKGVVAGRKVREQYKTIRGACAKKYRQRNTRQGGKTPHEKDKKERKQNYA